jgi:hypothetical protein
MDNSWNEVGSGEGFTYTPCIEIFDEQSQETEVSSGNHQLLCSFDSCFNCQPLSVCVQGYIPAQIENGAAQVLAVARQVAVKRIPRREKKISIKEDELLCSAYINISKDPIARWNQPMGAYWDNAIHYVFQVYLTPKSCRTLANGILCLEDTKGPFHIFSIFMMLVSK